jgi:hypothetical protein
MSSIHIELKLPDSHCERRKAIYLNRGLEDGFAALAMTGASHAIRLVLSIVDRTASLNPARC